MSSAAAVKLYTTRFCPYCIRAKRLLADKGVGFTDIAVDNDPGLREEMTFTFVDTIDEVFASALEPLDEAAPKHTPLVAAGAARKAART